MMPRQWLLYHWRASGRRGSTTLHYWIMSNAACPLLCIDKSLLLLAGGLILTPRGHTSPLEGEMRKPIKHLYLGNSGDSVGSSQGEVSCSGTP